MRRFERKPDGSVMALIDETEVTLLGTLAQQAAGVIAEADLGDPAVLRILPDAYPTDPEASAEFRRFTQGDLAGRKIANAERIRDNLATVESGALTLSPADIPAWLRGLTDIRLILAARLGIEADGDEQAADIDPMMVDVYDWLGFVQNSLIEAIDG